jgi:protein-disulfide isomerase
MALGLMTSPKAFAASTNETAISLLDNLSKSQYTSREKVTFSATDGLFGLNGEALIVNNNQKDAQSLNITAQINLKDELYEGKMHNAQINLELVFVNDNKNKIFYINPKEVRIHEENEANDDLKNMLQKYTNTFYSIPYGPLENESDTQMNSMLNETSSLNGIKLLLESNILESQLVNEHDYILKINNDIQLDQIKKITEKIPYNGFAPFELPDSISQNPDDWETNDSATEILNMLKNDINLSIRMHENRNLFDSVELQLISRDIDAPFVVRSNTIISTQNLEPISIPQGSRDLMEAFGEIFAGSFGALDNTYDEESMMWQDNANNEYPMGTQILPDSVSIAIDGNQQNCYYATDRRARLRLKKQFASSLAPSTSQNYVCTYGTTQPVNIEMTNMNIQEDIQEDTQSIMFNVASNLIEEAEKVNNLGDGAGANKLLDEAQNISDKLYAEGYYDYLIESLNRDIAFQRANLVTTTLTPSVKPNLRDDDTVFGNPNAPVSITVFTDYECPFCKKFENDTLSLVKKEYLPMGKVNIVYRDFPLTSMHPIAFTAAIATECAGEQGDEAYRNYHEALFKQSERLTKETLWDTAANLNLDIPAFESCTTNQDTYFEVMTDMKAGRELGIAGTPYSYINGELVKGAVDFETMKEIIERNLPRN